jgi:hypothetical protein
MEVNSMTNGRTGAVAEREERRSWQNTAPQYLSPSEMRSAISEMASFPTRRFYEMMPQFAMVMEELTRRCELVADGELPDEFNFLRGNARGMGENLAAILDAYPDINPMEREFVENALDALNNLLSVRGGVAMEAEVVEQVPRLQEPTPRIPYVMGETGEATFEFNPMTERLFRSRSDVEIAAGIASDILAGTESGDTLLESFINAIEAGTSIRLSIKELCEADWGDASEYIQNRFIGSVSLAGSIELAQAFESIRKGNLSSAIDTLPPDTPLKNALYGFVDYFLENNIVVFREYQISIGASASIRIAEHVVADFSAYQDTILLGGWRGTVEKMPDGRRRITYSHEGEWAAGARLEAGLRFPITSDAEYIRLSSTYEYSPEFERAGGSGHVFKVRIEAVDGNGELLEPITEGYVRLAAFGEFDITNRTFEAGGMVYVGSFVIGGVPVMLNFGVSGGDRLAEGGTPISPQGFLNLQEGASLLIPVHEGVLETIDLELGAFQVLSQRPDGTIDPEPIQYGGQLGVGFNLEFSEDFEMRPYIGGNVRHVVVAPQIARELYEVANGEATSVNVGLGVELRWK